MPKLHKPQSATKPFFRAAVTTNGEFELLIYDEIGEYFDWDTYSMAGTTAKSVRQSLDSAGQFSKIKVRINSPGGDAFEGVAIGNVLKATGKPIDVYIDGIAASAASIVAMCGSTITMASNAMMMVHKAWALCMGNSDDMLKMASTLDALDVGGLAQTYVDRTGKTMDEIMAMMKDETWMSARECLDNGFATAIADTANNEAVAMARGFKVLAKMKRVPDHLQNARPHVTPPVEASMDACGCECSACKGGNCSSCSMVGCEDPNCEDCPMQANPGNESTAEVTAESNLSLYESRLTVLDKRI